MPAVCSLGSLAGEKVDTWAEFGPRLPWWFTRCKTGLESRLSRIPQSVIVSSKHGGANLPDAVASCRALTYTLKRKSTTSPSVMT